jgi:alkanesulfonate monooxygenase SsuD/methylene tetrahydromethanopterin reductase-like flavin-dependent oxidoreductase (luciferase family)
MKFTLSEGMCDISHYIPLAKAADAAGFSHFSYGDSICFPEKTSEKYPYTETGDRSFLDGAPFLDPFQLFAAMSVVTNDLKFMTGVLKTPIRNPVLIAKMVSSLASFTNDRFILGVGLDPWPEDFHACGQDWKTRAPRMDEILQIIPGLMSGDYFEWHSEYYDIPRIKMCPTPSKSPTMIYGGHSIPAYRRAARYTDGFLCIGVTEEQLIERIALLKGFRKEFGKENEPFMISAGMPVSTLDEFRHLEDLGVSDLHVCYRNPYMPETMSIQEKVDWVHRFGDEVIAKY